jgi:uncharacterized membrane protein
MTENNDPINQLLDRLNALLKKQEHFSREVNELRAELNRLKLSQAKETIAAPKEIRTESVMPSQMEAERKVEALRPIFQTEEKQAHQEQGKYTSPTSNLAPKAKSDIEKFIGENLINKIGIAITVIGVAIGAKYSIEHQLISPLTRIILGYLMGLGLLGFGARLKKNYENYSAVLVGGAIAILYLITYSAYTFYGLMPQLFAFALMLLFTAFAVAVAIRYNKQVIAHIGLVGAYAVPFLLSEGSGKVAVLFSYMVIINIGILLIAFKKYWKSLYYSSFVLSWLIFFLWYATKYHANVHFALALTFLSAFFATFYLIFMAYKLRQKEKFGAGDIVLLLSNTFIFYGVGYSILSSSKTGVPLLGLFTLCNAVIHFVVSATIYKQKLADRNLFLLIAGLALVFVTIAIPVQLDGNWVTLLWAFEAALLFWIGRTKGVSAYEKLSYPLMALAFVSILQEWLTTYGHYRPEQPATRLIPLLNVNFLSSILFVASFAFIAYLHQSKKYTPALFPQKALNSIAAFAIPAILFIALYGSFLMEIISYWNQLSLDEAMSLQKEAPLSPYRFGDNDWSKFKAIWIINYSLLFCAILSFVNVKKLKNKELGLINIGLNAFFVLLFLSQGLYLLSELRDSYLNASLSPHHHSGVWNIQIRYLSFVFLGLLLAAAYQYRNQPFLKTSSFKPSIAFDALFYSSLLWVASSEWIAWMDMMKSVQSYKLGLSILWGLYALLLISLGIWKNKKHLRIAAIALFSATLIKLFVYDIAHLDTIAKTIVFVSLGLLLLIISFLYNKYKHLISEEQER